MSVMSLEQLHQKMLAAARANPPSDRVPYAFEKRIMARLAQAPKVDMWALWSHALWRAAAPCVAIALMLGAISYYHASTTTTDGGKNGIVAGGDNAETLSQHFETTMLAAVNEP